jgi:hypothetical protein
MGNFGEGKGPKFGPRMGLKKSLRSEIRSHSQCTNDTGIFSQYIKFSIISKHACVFVIDVVRENGMIMSMG